MWCEVTAIEKSARLSLLTAAPHQRSLTGEEAATRGRLWSAPGLELHDFT
jgi:hypothetical protein